ncbi:MAG: trimethylamine methyltransferase family protein [Eubacterium sp.]
MQVMTPEKTEKIHEQSLKILKEIGVQFEHEKVLAIFKEHGAKVDGNRVYLDEATIAHYMTMIPKSFVVKSSKGDSSYGTGECHKMPGAGNIYIQDKGVIRKMNNDDMIDQFKLSDTSKVLDTNFLNFFPDQTNFTAEQKIYGTMATHLKYSNKISPFNFPNVFQLDDIHDAFAKGIQLIKNFEDNHDDPVCIVSINTLSPLCYDHDPLEKMMITIEENQPIWISPCGMPLLTAPASLYGMMSMTNAETLAGLVLSQMLKPGTPCIYGNTSGSTNLKTIQLCIGSSETALVTYATKALANYYGLPCRAGGGLSDAKDFDFQAGSESTMMIQSTLDARPDIIFHACGILGSFNIVSFEKCLADEEIYKMSERLLRGIDCSDEKNCFETIAKTGPRGTFLKGRTPKMYKEEFMMATYFNKDDPNQWQQHGSISIRESIDTAVKNRIHSYTPPQITKTQEKLLAPYLPTPYQNHI